MTGFLEVKKALISCTTLSVLGTEQLWRPALLKDVLGGRGDAKGLPEDHLPPSHLHPARNQCVACRVAKGLACYTRIPVSACRVCVAVRICTVFPERVCPERVCEVTLLCISCAAPMRVLSCTCSGPGARSSDKLTEHSFVTLSLTDSDPE